MTSRPWTRRHFLQTSTLAGSTLLLPRRSPAQQPAPTGDVTLQTPLGTLRGLQTATTRVFRGVPFAEPPIGPLRFRPPQPKQPWTGVRDATHFAPAAPQAGDRNVPQDEDCLYLNIWSPLPTPRNLPVFVWIHGGGFTGGESFAPIFDGTGFAEQGIVVVTVAYRLGVLGFLDVEPLLGPAYAGSANNALRDLIQALHWVQANIPAFGGDPTRVTIGGESAGAKLTDLLMGIPAAKPLFSGMISESGGAERIWPKSNAQAVAQGFGKLWTRTSSKPLTALQTAPAPDLINLQTDLMNTWPQHFPLRCEIDGTLIPKLPIQTIAAGSASGKRLLIGSNRDESALFLGAHAPKPITAADLGNTSLDRFNAIYAQYAQLYPDMPESQRRIRAVTAEEYWVPSIRVADAAATSGAHVWMYELDYSRDGGPFQGEAFHSEDLGLVWNKPDPHFISAPAEAHLAQEINTAWASFIKGEAPAAPGLPTWPAYNSQTRPTMLLNRTSHVQNAPQQAELALWSSL